MKRRRVSKFHSARKFRRHVGRTKKANMMMAPMRGGWRM